MQLNDTSLKLSLPRAMEHLPDLCWTVKMTVENYWQPIITHCPHHFRHY